ncbi:hypothetical protein [Brucella pituitosa]|uniref:hypothetical protein n=1 Tax=Brucella pituitosa TaxID=571256 RepID=UPI000CFE6958|nr:hypothetical protein CQ062_12005 [Ochrobactrum sp. MYb68]
MSATITDDKPLATNIAAYIAQFVTTEMLLQAIFEKAIDGDGTWSDSILHHVQSISTRVDIIEDFLKNCRSDLQMSSTVVSLIPEVRRAISYRNKIAHGLYANSKEDGRSVIIGNLFARKKTFKQENITAEGVLFEFYRLEQLHLDLMFALGVAPAGHARIIPREYSPNPDVG